MPQDKPKIHLNLDKLDGEGDVEPFAVIFGAKRYVLPNPQDMDWNVILEAQQLYGNGDAKKAIGMILDEKDRDSFFDPKNRMTPRKLTAFFTAYNAHYGLDPGEARAS